MRIGPGLWRGGRAVSSFSPWGGRVCSRVSPPRGSLPPCLSSSGVSPPRSPIQRVSPPRGSLPPRSPLPLGLSSQGSLLPGGLSPQVSPPPWSLLPGGFSSQGGLSPQVSAAPWSLLPGGLSPQVSAAPWSLLPWVSPSRGLVSVPPPSGPSMTLRVRSVSFGCLPFAGAAVGSTSLERPPHWALKAQEGLRPGPSCSTQ